MLSSACVHQHPAVVLRRSSTPPPAAMQLAAMRALPAHRRSLAARAQMGDLDPREDADFKVGFGPSVTPKTKTKSGQVPFSFGAANAKPADPFATAPAPPTMPPPPGAPVGFFGPGVNKDRLLPVAEAETLLRRFDEEQRKAGGQYGKTLAGHPDCTLPPLRTAAHALAGSSVQMMMGICANNQSAGVQALKCWTEGLGLPKGKLHGMDLNGKPVDVPGAVFVKYNSVSGDAFLSGYAGEYRGVLVTPLLPDGEFRQYGYLPLDLLKPE